MQQGHDLNYRKKYFPLDRVPVNHNHIFVSTFSFGSLDAMQHICLPQGHDICSPGGIIFIDKNDKQIDNHYNKGPASPCRVKHLLSDLIKYNV